MNRIYQGRVTKVEVPNPDKEAAEKWIKLEDGEAALWRHHEVFRDAVNGSI